MSAQTAALFRQAAIMAQKKRRGRAPRRVPMLYPWALERKYAQKIAEWLRPVMEYAEEYLMRRAETILNGDSADLHADAIPGAEYAVILKTLSGWAAGYFGEQGGAAAIELGLGELSAGVRAFAGKEWGKATKSLLGFEFDTTQSWWKPTKEAWAAENYDLITSLSDTYITRLNRIVEKAVINGYSRAQLQRDIRALNKNITSARARLLARDQIGKLNGRINQAQQEEVGVERYEWLTAGDERVRGNPAGKFPRAVPSHYIMNHKICRWDNAGVYLENGKWVPRTGKMPLSHPGEDIQCRCVAAPDWTGILE